MTCRSLRVRGSMADHDLLLAAFIAWRETQQASDLNWACHEEAAYADAARLDLQGHAIVCGYEPRHGDLIRWAARRVNAYAVETIRRERLITSVPEIVSAKRRAS